MKWNGEFWANTANTASTAAPDSTLTLEKLREVMALIPPWPPEPKFDLYGHDLPDQAQAYELGEEAFKIIGEKRERRFLIVPRKRLHAIAYELRKLGADVRVEPRIGDSVSEGESR